MMIETRVHPEDLTPSIHFFNLGDRLGEAEFRR